MANGERVRAYLSPMMRVISLRGFSNGSSN
jgi:hypothetical protein